MDAPRGTAVRLTKEDGNATLVLAEAIEMVDDVGGGVLELVLYSGLVQRVVGTESDILRLLGWQVTEQVV